jgi:plasmid stabilization system protein ParE
VAFEDRDDIVFRHSQRHYVFALRERDRPLIVIAVLHESMDLLTRVRARLVDG